MSRIAGFWDGRDIVVIFWMECIIIIFYSMYRELMKIDENLWSDLFGLIVLTVLLVYLWGLSGSLLYQDLFLSPGPLRGTRVSEDMGNMLGYVFSNYGWVVVSVLLVIHGAEEVKLKKWSDGYRNLPRHLGMNTGKYLISLYVVTVFVGIAARIFGPDSRQLS